MSRIRLFFASIVAWFSSLFSKTTTVTPGPAAQPTPNVVPFPVSSVPNAAGVGTQTVGVAVPIAAPTGTASLTVAPGTSGTATIGGFNISDPTAKPATSAPAAAAPAEKPFDPKRPDPVEFFAGIGRWMEVLGTNSISGTIQPGRYTSLVGEGNDISGTITVAGISTALWGHEFVVTTASPATLSVSGNGTIQLQKLATAAPPVGLKPFFQVPPSK